MESTLVFHSNSELLEGPVFDHENQLLYFVSILDGLAYCYTPSTNEVLSIKFESPVSCIFIKGYKKVLAASKNGFFELDFNTLGSKFVFQIDIKKDVRYNDGIQDAKERVLIGTMGYPEVKENVGQVFSYYQGQYKTIIPETTISNGMAFSKDKKTLYFIDTPTKKVARYLYDLETGDATFDSHIIEFKGEGSPDGMCIDNDGMLWIAEWGGSCVSKWNPSTGIRLEKKKLPCTNVTSCCFDNKSNLYVTTAKSDSEMDYLGGGLFYIELNNH